MEDVYRKRPICMSYNSSLSERLSCLTLFYILAFHTGLSFCSIVLPDKLHCISEVNTYNKDGTTKSYNVNEFVDSIQSKSALEIRDYSMSKTQVVYNFPCANRLLYFMVYDLEQNFCFLYRNVNLFVELTRKYAKILELDEEEVFFGPVAILKSIESCMNQFKYVETDTSETPPRYIFQKVVKFHPDLESGKSLVVTVKLTPSTKAIFAISGSNLDEMKENLEYHSVTTCIVPSSSLKDTQKRYLCKREELSLEITYFLIADMVLGTNVGRLLEPTVEQHDFESNPFTQPVGIGCTLKTLRGQKMFRPLGNQFSAEYETLIGDEGVSFMAFDSDKKLLRYDRKGRKNVYDLKERLSSHSNEFDSLEDLMQLPDTVPNDCLVLELLNDKRYPENLSTNQLIGVGMNTLDAAIYMGSRVIDHVNYEIYEKRVDVGKIPLIMDIDPNMIDLNLMYFMSYYVEEYIYVSKVVVPGFDDYVSIPKFMELWAYDPINRIKTLLNMVTFSKFSWMIDVYPSEDADSMDLFNMFTLPGCSEHDTNRIGLSFLIESDQVTKETLIGDRAPQFRSSTTQLINQISSHISKQLQTSHLNLISFKLDFKPKESTNIFVDTRLSSLKLGLIDGTVEAHVSYSDFQEMFNSVAVSIDTESYDLKECQLKSVMTKGENYAIHCENQNICAIIWKEDLDLEDKNIHKGLPQQSIGNSSVCLIHSFRFQQIDSEKEFLLSKMRLNFETLSKSEIKIEIKTRDKGRRPQFIKYTGKISLPALKVLDWSLSSREQMQLQEISYVVNQGTNYNLALKVESRSSDDLRQCQLACQLDNYCQSFSFCSSGDRSGECILSTLLLDSDHIVVLKGMPIDAHLNPFNEVYGSAEDPGCSIHPREALPSFSANHTLMLSRDVSSKVCATSSLDECATRSHDKWFSTLLTPTNFVYCPMTSCCILNEGDAKVDRTENSQECQVYSRVFSEFFEKRSFARMILEVGKDESAKYMESFAGIGDEECARLCRGRHSKCLAYDTCMVEATPVEQHLCILHSAISPLGIQINTNDPSHPPSKLIGSSNCHHRAMRNIYATSRELISSNVNNGATGVNNPYELEDRIRKLAKLKSKSSVELIRKASERYLIVQPKSRGEFSTFTLMIGIVLGIMGLLYHDFAIEKMKNFWSEVRFRINQFRRRNSDINLLTLPEEQI